MRPRYYVHMAPRPAENVSCLWKASHITIFLLLVCSSSIATVCIYDILEMYTFHCIIYARVSFEHTFEDRMKEINETELMRTEAEETEGTNVTTAEEIDATDANDAADEKEARVMEPDCTKDPNAPGCDKANKSEMEMPANGFIELFRQWKGGKKKKMVRGRPLNRHVGHAINETMEQSMMLHALNVNNTGFLNMRKTIFATIYMCDLMLFSPLASIIMAIFLGALIAVGGRGGAGNPGDLLPNPWICVYPFLGLCAFMMILCFISDNLFHHGLATFCAQYLPITKVKWCSEEMDAFNVQFSEGKKGPPKPFYMTYYVGSIGVQLTSALWVAQTLMYMLRILCVADFSVYMTRIRLKTDEGRPDRRLGSVVFNAMDTKTKLG